MADGVVESRVSQPWVRSVISHVPLLIFYVDDGGVIRLAEGRGLALLELDAGRLVDVSFAELFSDRPGLLDDVRRALGGDSFRGRLQIGDRAFASSFHPVRGAAAVEGVVVTLADVTEHDRAEEALRRSEASFRTLIESSPDAVFVHRFGRLVYVNPTAVSLLGVSEESELVGRPMLELFAEDHRDAAGAQIRKLVDDGEVITHEVDLVRADGTRAMTEMRAMSFTFDGEAAVLAVGRDITERKRLQSQLLQTDRLASLGIMAAGVAHQINNPLSYMITNLLFLTDEIKRMTSPAAEPLDDAARAEMRTALKDTLDGAERVRQIVRHLGTFARPQDQASGRVDVAEAVDAAIRMAWHQLRKVSQIRLDYRARAVVRAGSAGLGQVFFHLLANAAQAVQSQPMFEREVSVVVRVDGAQAVIEVGDTGPGIEPSVLGSIFDPFFTTRPFGQGTGLGLSVCHSIVTSLGGTIEVASAVGKGCRFIVAVPLDVSETRTGEAEDERLRCLLIQNETWTLHVLQDALRGHLVSIAPDESSALHVVAGASFDLVVADVVVISGGPAGFRAALAERGYDDSRHVVYLTHDDRDGIEPDGSSTHELRKPFKRDAVKELVVGLARSTR